MKQRNDSFDRLFITGLLCLMAMLVLSLWLVSIYFKQISYGESLERENKDLQVKLQIANEKIMQFDSIINSCYLINISHNEKQNWNGRYREISKRWKRQ